MHNTGIIITMAYPETIVMVADEWYSPLLRWIGIGKKNYLRAGHAALVLIDKQKGDLEYHDFGRYITNAPNGRVRGMVFDTELNFLLKAIISNGEIKNLDEILLFLASNPKLTHGDGKLIASVCYAIDYKEAKSHIQKMQRKGGIRYAAFLKEATNCARFVTDTLIASTTNNSVKKALQKSSWFTPSTVGNVVLAASDKKVFEVTEKRITEFTSSSGAETRKCFLDKLPNHIPNFKGTLQSVKVNGLHNNAQWLSGIAAGAWYEITKCDGLKSNEFRFRRISAYGNVDIDAVFVSHDGFTLSKPFEIIHNSNCLFCAVKQKDTIKVLNYRRLFAS